MAEPFRPNPRFAKTYLRLAAKAEARGVAAHRDELLADLAGVVCEVGAGPGLNFAYYPTTVTRVIAVEPEPTLRAQAAEVAYPRRCRSRSATAPLTPCRSRTPAATRWCSRWSFDGARPGCRASGGPPGPAPGRAAPVLRAREVPAPARRGRREPARAAVGARCAGGCHPNRDTVAALDAAGFEVSAVRRLGFSAQRGIPRPLEFIGRGNRR